MSLSYYLQGDNKTYNSLWIILWDQANVTIQVYYSNISNNRIKLAENLVDTLQVQMEDLVLTNELQWQVSDNMDYVQTQYKNQLDDENKGLLIKDI